MVLLILAGNTIYFNRTDYNMYFWFGIIQAAGVYVYIMFNAIIMTYDTINSVYLQSRYPVDEYVTIQFGTLANAFGMEEGDPFLRGLVYLEQLFIGNKRLSLYNNLMMGAL